jgi:hypothetical protein
MNKLEQLKEQMAKETAQAVFCARCGQLLKDPVSIARKLGPICAEKVSAEENNSDTE